MGPFDSSDTALFREIADSDPAIRFRRKPYQETNSFLNENKQSSETEIQPFTSFGDVNSNKKETFEGKIPEINKPSMSSMDFHNQYGQHDDRPIRLPTLSPVKKEIK